MWSTRFITGTPPNPGVRVTFSLHQGLITWPILSWIACVRSVGSAPVDLVVKATAYLADCLEVLHDLDGQYADSTHATNTDPSPMLAGEGRYFMVWDAAQPLARREGYSYLPGGVQLPINQDLQVAAALYVAYRLTRGTGNAPTAKATGFKTKADGILKRWKRMTTRNEGALAWTYTRAGTWQNTV